MNKVKIDDTTRILVEDDNYTLEYKVKSGLKPDGTKSTKEFKWVLGGYFPTIEQVLNDYVKNAPSHQKDGSIQSLQDIIDCIREARETIKKLIK